MRFRIQFLNRSASRLAVSVYVDHGRLDFRMTQYLLKGENVCSLVGQPSSEGMTQIMKTKVLDLRFLNRTRETLLEIDKSTTIVSLPSRQRNPMRRPLSLARAAATNWTGSFQFKLSGRSIETTL
jgi:hypothetical protein